jgi:hypothetical protein
MLALVESAAPRRIPETSAPCARVAGLDESEKPANPQRRDACIAATRVLVGDFSFRPGHRGSGHLAGRLVERRSSSVTHRRRTAVLDRCGSQRELVADGRFNPTVSNDPASTWAGACSSSAHWGTRRLTARDAGPGMKGGLTRAAVQPWSATTKPSSSAMVEHQHVQVVSTSIQAVALQLARNDKPRGDQLAEARDSGFVANRPGSHRHSSKRGCDRTELGGENGW